MSSIAPAMQPPPESAPPAIAHPSAQFNQSTLESASSHWAHPIAPSAVVPEQSIELEVTLEPAVDNSLADPAPIAQADGGSVTSEGSFRWPGRPAESVVEPFAPETSDAEAEHPLAEHPLAEQPLDGTRSPEPTLLNPEPVLPQAEVEISEPSLEMPGRGEQDASQISITQLEVLGSSVFAPEVFAPIVEPLAGRAVTLAELSAASDAITQLYLNRGYITSRALDPVIAEDGNGTIQIVEGKLADIEIEGTHRVSQNYIRDRIRLGAQTPLNPNRLEAQLKLLRNDPLFTEFSASLRAGKGLGESILAVKVKESKSVIGEIKLENNAPPAVSSEAVDAQLAYRNVTGGGDELSLGYRITRTGGLQQLRWGYRLPVNAKDGSLSLSGDRSWTHITQGEFQDLGIRGESERYELTYRQPLIRRPQQEFALSAGVKFQSGQTFVFDNLPTPFGQGPDERGVSRTVVLNLGQDYVKRDPGGAWAVGSRFNLGLDILDATQNSGSVPDGQFFSWVGQVQRVQRLSEAHLLLASAEIQLTPDSLLPSEQFALGGAQSLRGYRQNQRSGDNGFRVSVEDRITLRRNEAGASTLLLTPFVEVGKVWNQANNPNGAGRPRLLASTGLGVIWQPRPAVTVRLDYGLPLISLKDDGKSLQDRGLHFSASYRF